MSTLVDRPERALVVVDMQVGVVNDAHEIDEVTATVADLVERARRAGVGVVWVQDVGEDRVHGSEAWQLVEALQPATDEPRIDKAYGDAFAETDLEEVLADRSVGELVLVGAASEQCIRCTMHSAVIHGYDVALVAGGHTTEDLTAYGMPEPAVVRAFIDSVARFGMQWPGRAGHSVTPDEVGF